MKNRTKPYRFCRGILPQFADKILSGEKTTTIRPDTKNMQAGDLISFWVGWRKKNPQYVCTVEILEEPNPISLQIDSWDKTKFIAVIDGGEHYFIDEWTGAYVPHFSYNEEEDLDLIAKNDGFPSFADMITFFQTAYPPKKNEAWKFNGKLITFGNVRVETERYNNKKCLIYTYPNTQEIIVR